MFVNVSGMRAGQRGRIEAAEGQLPLPPSFKRGMSGFHATPAQSQVTPASNKQIQFILIFQLVELFWKPGFPYARPCRRVLITFLISPSKKRIMNVNDAMLFSSAFSPENSEKFNTFTFYYPVRHIYNASIDHTVAPEKVPAMVCGFLRDNSRPDIIGKNKEVPGKPGNYTSSKTGSPLSRE
ncbi:MAG: hypothetical protein ACYC5N_04265 [Endomicrobiales bacterium]